MIKPEQEFKTHLGAVETMRLNGAEQLREVWFGLRVHAYGDDERDETVVGDYFSFLHGPCAPYLHGFPSRALSRFLFPLQRSHGFLLSSFFFFTSVSVLISVLEYLT